MKCNQCLAYNKDKCRFNLKNTLNGCDYHSAQIRKLLRLRKEGNKEEIKEYLHDIIKYNKFQKRSY